MMLLIYLKLQKLLFKSRTLQPSKPMKQTLSKKKSISSTNKPKKQEVSLRPMQTLVESY